MFTHYLTNPLSYLDLCVKWIMVLLVALSHLDECFTIIFSFPLATMNFLPHPFQFLKKLYSQNDAMTYFSTENYPFANEVLVLFCFVKPLKFICL